MKRQTVLIIDDDQSVRAALKRLLESYGYDVLSATNGLVALRLLTSFRVDVILLDERMPVMNGKVFRERQLANPRFARIPVLLISDAPNLRDFEPDKGVVEHAPKNDPDTIVAAIARVCLARTPRSS